MPVHIRNGIRTGISFGALLLFISLIAFPVILAELVEEAIGNPSGGPLDPDLIGYGIVLFIIGIFGGIAAARPLEEHDTTSRALISGLLGGLISGLFLSVLIISMVVLRLNEIDPREYLVQFSPLVIRLYAFDILSPLPAALINIAIITFGSGLGSVLRKALRNESFRENVSTRRSNAQQAVNESAPMRYLRENRLARYALYAFIVLILLAMPQFLSRYWNFVLGTIGIYVLMGLGLNLEIGFAGLLDIGYVAFFAVGAYTVGLLTSPEINNLTWNWWIVFPIGVGLAGLAGVILGIPVLRLRGDYLAIVTLGLGEIIRILIKSDVLTDFSGGPQGIRNIAQPYLFGINFGNERAFVYFIVLGIILAIVITIRLRDSHVGRAWMALREDETVARAMGIDHVYFKLLAFGMGAAFAGFAGVLFASRNQFTGPEDHVLLVSINVLAEVIVGGMGSIPGVITGAFALKGLPEILRQLEDYRVLTFGALLVIMMILRPEGLWPSQRRRREIALEESFEQIRPDEDSGPETEEGETR